MLKKCLLGLFVGFVGFISFSNAGVLSFTGTIPTDGNAVRYYFEEGNNICDYYISCVFTNSSTFYFTFLNSYKTINGTSASNSMGSQAVYNNHSYINHVVISDCSGMSSIGLSRGNGSDFECFIYGGDVSDVGNSSCPECQECPEIDTGAILSGSCDINYCVQNDLCPLSSGSRSELMINDIVHEGKPLINISIPDNIYWDYATDDNQFDLYVGSGYNQDYIDSVLAINSYRPDNEDFTNIFVSGLTLIFPYIFVALLIVFIWKLLKRIFK